MLVIVIGFTPFFDLSASFKFIDFLQLTRATPVLTLAEMENVVSKLCSRPFKFTSVHM